MDKAEISATTTATPRNDIAAGELDLTPESADTSTAATERVAAERKRRHRRMLGLGLLAVWGPGLIVMLADTDAGCLITAAQTGSQFGFAMIIPQIVLIPILFMVQEMTVRLGVITGKGHGELIRDRFNPKWAYLSATTLLLSAIGALLTEFAGVAGVGEVFGISKWFTVPVATVILIGITVGFKYRKVEGIGIAFGLAELAFIPAMLLAHPSVHKLIKGATSIPFGNHSFMILLAANIGAVIMPWMIFYQQGAVIDKGIRPAELKKERHDTAVGSVLTQGIMIVVIIAMAATVYVTHRGAALNTVGQIADALAPSLGSTTADVLVGAAILGGAVVAALVVSLAGAWGMAEVFGWLHSCNDAPNRNNIKFYAVYCIALVIGAALVLASVDLVSLAVDVEVMNSLLLPLVLGFLLTLEAKALPAEHRMHGPYRWTVYSLCAVVMGFGLFMIPSLIGL